MEWIDPEGNQGQTVSTLQITKSVAADRCASFQENWWTDQERKEEHVSTLTMMICCCKSDVSPSNKLMDRSRTKGENVSSLRWWSVAANRCDLRPSNKLMDRLRMLTRNCFYFAMMICWCWWISVLSSEIDGPRSMNRRILQLLFINYVNEYGQNDCWCWWISVTLEGHLPQLDSSRNEVCDWF